MGYGWIVEGYICGFVVVVCLRICGWQWVVVGGKLLWLVEFCVGRWIVMVGGFYLEYFPECKQTTENIPFSLKLFAFENILR